MKRLFDIVCSFFGLVFLSWLFVFVALWVGLSSRGGVCFIVRGEWDDATEISLFINFVR